MNQKIFSNRLAIIGSLILSALVGMLYLDQRAASANTPDQAISFYDDFSGDLSLWSDQIGDWMIDQGELVGTGYGGMIDAWIYAGDTSWTDYILQTKVIFVSSNAILVVRSTGHWENEYRVDLWMQGGENSNRYQVQKYQDGVLSDITPGLVISPVPITNPSLVQVVAEGDYIAVYVNGLLMTEFTDSDPLLNGRIGLGVIWTYTSRFDDVVVSHLSVQKTVDKSIAYPGDLLSYNITISNIGQENIDDVTVIDVVPSYLTYLNGSLTATSGSYEYTLGHISWTGTITASETVTITFDALVSPYPAVMGKTITNEAIVSVDSETLTASATTQIIPHYVFLPCAYKPCLPDIYTDDFSDPNSGWYVGETTTYKMGYVDGEYQILVKPEGYIVWSWRDFGVYDFEVEIDARPVKHLNGAVGIMFSVNSYGFYVFEVSDGWYGLWRVDWATWSWVTLIDWTTSPAVNPGFASNHLKVERVQGKIDLYANGQLLSTLNDYTYVGGAVGMVAEGWDVKYDTRFDNFLISSGCFGAPGGLTIDDNTLIISDSGSCPR